MRNDGLFGAGEVTLELDLGTADRVAILTAALSPEIMSAPSDRSTVSLDSHGSVLVIRISAQDLAALRAAMNSYLSWVSACLRTVDTVTGQKP